MATATFEDRPCPAKPCTGVCVYQVKGAPAVATANMTNPSFDVVVGADSERRWNSIRERQAARDKLRQESGEHALQATGTGKTDYRPLSGAKLTPVVIPESAQEKF